MTRARRGVAFVALALVFGLIGSTGAGAGAAPAGAATGRVNRLLVFSLPDLTWTEMRNAPMPNLRRFLTTAAVANLAPARMVSHVPGPGDAYLTFSAGTRAVGRPAVDGGVYERDEPIDGTTAGARYTRLTGNPVRHQLVVPGWSPIARANDRLPYGTAVGAVTHQLERNGVSVAAIANADGSDGPGPAAVHREAALAVVSSVGQVQSGDVGTDLLMRDPAAPFGVRMRPAAVAAAFDRAWNGPGGPRRVVVVEASDLARALRYRALATPAQADTLRRTALAEADVIFGALLRDVDPTRDAVMVLGSPSSGNEKMLTLAARHAPGDASGWLRSASTQHAGVVMTIDVGPAMLDLFGIDFTGQMEGRPFEVVASHGSLTARAHRLVDDARGSVLRNDRLVPMTMLLVALLAVIALATVMAVAYPEWASPARKRAIAGASLFALAVIPASLLAEVLPGHLGGMGAYLFAVTAIAVVLTAAAWMVPRRPFGPLVTMCGIVAGVVLLDAITGSHMQYNAVFGYAPTSNSRLYGISNYTFGTLAVAAIVLAGFALAFLRERIAMAVAIAVLMFTLVVDGLPVWGADVGGVLAFVPTILVFVALARRGRVRVRNVVIAIGATAAAIGAFAALDLARPADQRAHLGRLVERVSSNGAGPLTSVVHRKLIAALNESVHSFWLAAIPIGLLVVYALARLGDRPLDRLRKQVPTLGVVCATVFVVAVLGSALNDSGAIVGGIALFTLSGALCYLTMETA